MKAKKGTAKAMKIQAKPLTDSQIQEFVNFYNKNKSFPGSKIPCNITGKLTTCVGPWMVKKIKEFGGAEKLLRNYKCRGAIKSQKQTVKPVTAKNKRRIKIKELKDGQKNWDIPKVDFTPPKPLTDNEITDTTKNTCIRPDIFLDNDRHCHGCEFYDLCINSMKCLPKWTKADKKTKK